MSVKINFEVEIKKVKGFKISEEIMIAKPEVKDSLEKFAQDISKNLQAYLKKQKFETEVKFKIKEK